MDILTILFSACAGGVAAWLTRPNPKSSKVDSEANKEIERLRKIVEELTEGLEERVVTAEEKLLKRIQEAQSVHDLLDNKLNVILSYNEGLEESALSIPTDNVDILDAEDPAVPFEQILNATSAEADLIYSTSAADDFMNQSGYTLPLSSHFVAPENEIPALAEPLISQVYETTQEEISHENIAASQNTSLTSMPLDRPDIPAPTVIEPVTNTPMRRRIPAKAFKRTRVPSITPIIEQTTSTLPDHNAAPTPVMQNPSTVHNLPKSTPEPNLTSLKNERPAPNIPAQRNGDLAANAVQQKTAVIQPDLINRPAVAQPKSAVQTQNSASANPPQAVPQTMQQKTQTNPAVSKPVATQQPVTAATVQRPVQAAAASPQPARQAAPVQLAAAAQQSRVNAPSPNVPPNQPVVPAAKKQPSVVPATQQNVVLTPLPANAKAKSEHDQKQLLVMRLVASGVTNSIEIARRTGLTRGEVELILGLKNLQITPPALANQPAPAVESKPAAAAQSGADDRYAAIYALVASGITDSVEIARRTGLGRGEVELLMGLHARNVL